MNYNLKLPKEKRQYFEYYEKTLIEEKIEELVKDKVLLEEKIDDTNDVIVSDKDILSSNSYTYFWGKEYNHFSPKYFYNLSLAEKIFGNDFIVEIIYYVVQRFLRGIVDYIEESQKKSNYTQYHININVLKQINYGEANKKIVDFFKVFNDDNISEDDEVTEKEFIHVLDVKNENGLGYDDNELSLMDFDSEEKLQNIVEAIIKEWFRRIFYEDYEPVFYK